MVFNFAKLLMPSTMVAVPAGIVVVSYIQKSATPVPHGITPQPTPEDASPKTVDTKTTQPVEDANTADSTTLGDTVPASKPLDEITPAAKPNENPPGSPIDTPIIPPVPPAPPNPDNTTTTDQSSSDDANATTPSDTIPPVSQPESTPSGDSIQSNPVSKTSSPADAISTETIQKAVRDPQTREALISLIQKKKDATNQSANPELYTKLENTLNLLKTLNESANTST